MKRGQRKLAPGPQTQAMTKGRAVGQQKMLAQALKNQGPTARTAVPRGPGPGTLKQLLANRDAKMPRKRKGGRMPRRKSLIPEQSAL